MNAVNVAGARPLSQFLRMAVMAGVESAVQIHIDRGDDLNARDAGGMTPLMLSAARNKAAICRLLLSAGADHGLLDPSGRTALEIAVAAGSNDAAAILGALHAPLSSPPPPEPDLPPFSKSSSINSFPDLDVAADMEHAARADLPEPEVDDAVPERKDVAPPRSILEMDDGAEFDLSGWEAEEEAAPPEADLAVLGSASAIQSAITSHEPFDSSAGWDDIDAYLPEQALPLACADDAESHARLRRLLLRAIREGSVPILDVQELSINDDRSANPEAEAFLSMVVNDLGAEVDERFEYTDAFENFKVFVAPEETPGEEKALDEALAAIDSATSPHHEPLRIYQREFQRLRLLTAEEEIELAQAMEAALQAALDALAGWPEGIARTLAAGAEAMAGTRLLSSIWLGDSEPDPEQASADDLDATTSAADSAAESTDEDGEPVAMVPTDAGDTGFADALARLGTLAADSEAQPLMFREIRDALAAVRLNRQFLLELGDRPEASAPYAIFRHALTAFRRARDRMTAANLKLAFFHAKKFMYSGEPLDDLAQEANIGLLKAVDRYEWRLGYRFSTYATWWIRQQLGRYVADKARTIRVPVHVHDKTQRLERETEAFERTHGREPTIDELASRLEMPAHRVVALLRIAPEPWSIHELPVDEMIAADARDAFTEPDPADVIGEAEVRAAVNSLLSSLPIKEEQILRLRFGIGVEEVLILEEIGQRYAVTRERIRQIEAKALRMLKHPARSESFARLALGINSPPPSPAPITQGPDDPDDGETADQVSEPQDQQQSPSPRADLAPSESASDPKPSSLDRLLVQAATLGIPVEDDRSGPSGRIWVNLLDMPDNTHRRLVRRLLESGFAFWPGKGYWR